MGGRVRDVGRDFEKINEKLKYNLNLSKLIESYEKQVENKETEVNSERVRVEILRKMKEVRDKETDLETFELMKVNEDQAGLHRMHEMDTWILELREKEDRLQAIFSNLNKEIKDLSNPEINSNGLDSN